MTAARLAFGRLIASLALVALVGAGLWASEQPAAKGSQIGPLLLDPQGADFIAWINHFKDQVYRHWPPADLEGDLHGHVEVEFIVARDGKLLRVRVMKASGNKEVRKAAVDALQASTFLPLPADYKPETVTMQVAFYLNETLPAVPRPAESR